MTSIPAIRAGVATRLETIQGLRVEDKVTASINPPAAIIYPAPGTFITYDQAMGGADDILITITLLVSRATDRTAQQKLDEYLANTGAKSIKAAVDGDLELGGAAQYATVTSAANYGPMTFGEGDAAITYLGCDFTVTIGAI